MRALRAGLIAYDRRHGWRGAPGISISTPIGRPPSSNYTDNSGIDTWRAAMVTAITPLNEADIVLQNGAKGHIPF